MNAALRLRFDTLDVFTDRPYCGNPLAVVHDADALGTRQMQALAREFNLSETVFLLRPQHPGSAARLRIFTPRAELPFAGHPTIGSAHAVLDSPTVWAGTLDQMPISRGVNTSTIGVTALHRGATFRNPKPLRYTDSDQQQVSAGDTSMRYVVSQSQHQDIWPAASFFRQ